VKVVREGTFVGVVAETEWAAIQAARTLKVSWSEPTLKMMSGPTEVFDYLKNTKSFKDNVITNRGNLDAAFSQAQKKYEATYYWPFQLHGMMGPPCALADVRGDKATIWTGTQGPFRTRDAIAKMLSIPPKKRSPSLPGRCRKLRPPRKRRCGRGRGADVPRRGQAGSCPMDARRRTRLDPKGPAQLTTIRAGVDAQGNVIAWDFMDRSLPWSESEANPLLASTQIGLKPSGPGFLNGAGGGGQIYTFENQKSPGGKYPLGAARSMASANQQSSRAR